jgi:cell division inhibitor SepF
MAGTAAFKKIVNYFWGEPGADEQMDGDIEPIDNGYAPESIDGEEISSNVDTINPFKRRGRIVSLPQAQQIKMKISKPTNFDQVDEVISELKDKNAVVINLEYVSKDVARRIVDVIGGAVKALDGHIEKVSNSIFVVAPINYDIMNEATKEKIERKYSAPLMK